MHRLRVKLNLQAVLLCDPVQDVSRDPQLVARRNAFGRSDLVLPLPRRHLGVHPRDRKPGVDARLEVLVNDGPPERVGTTGRAVVLELRLRVPMSREAERLARLGVNQEKFLLDPKPRLLLELGIEHRLGPPTRVAGDRLARHGCHRLAHHKLVGALPEGARVHRHWVQEDLRVGPRGLLRRRAVIVPDRKVRWGSHLLELGRKAPAGVKHARL
mmetsp:Transcript_21845/g.65283  ORF Transcript_21845/g.65283 Transcript_21845/m.65283 type:complete len:214 (-) Transcript_21845:79-720(-)